MEFTVEQTIIILDALRFYQAIKSPTGKTNDTCMKIDTLMSKFNKQIIGKTKKVRVKK